MLAHRLRRRYRHALTPRSDLIRLGTGDGAWIIPLSRFDDQSVCFSAGVGEDLSFECALMERFRCSVHAFDPTPRAIAHAARHDHIAGFHFHPIGLWSRSETLRFFAPRNPAHVSHSVVNLQRTDTFFEADCRSPTELVREFGLERLTLLKLDIEGAEYEVLGAVLDGGLEVEVICVEFDQPVPIGRTSAMVDRLLGSGYHLVSIDRLNYTFVAQGP